MRTLRSLAVAGAAALMFTACQDSPVSPAVEEPAAGPAAEGLLDPVFARAADEFAVPAPILKGIAHAETRFQMVRGEEEFPGMAPAFGVMALRGERLQQGAALARVGEQAARSEARANIRAAAALLSSDAEELRINRSDLGAWAPVVARYSGIASPEGQAAYVHNDVYAALQQGIRAETPRGEVVASQEALRGLSPAFARPAAPEPAVAALSGSMALNIVWRPSPNYNDRPTGTPGDVHMVVIHTCESGYSGCWSWLTNSSSGVSAHYVVREDGAEISKLVYESKRAWHIGATYYCSNNSGHACHLDGYSSNHFTVGIEHGGYASQTSFPTGQINASAELSCTISKNWNIPRDRYHYVAHGQLQPYNRTDPGPNWPWSDYMAKINNYCGSGSIIIDSNNNNNDTSKGYIEVSPNWTSSSGTSGYYGSGYYYASTQAISDPATFWFYLPAAATKTVDAWWTAGSNRSSSAPFLAYNASGTKLGTAYANQQADGGKWNALGTYSFSAGWNKVQLSRWTTEGYVVIADAVRIR